MADLRAGDFYSKDSLWSLLHPGAHIPSYEPWPTAYAEDGDYLLIFAELGSGGGKNVSSHTKYEASSGNLEWFGKPNSHSAQPIFRSLFDGKLSPLIFVRWDLQEADFVYLGQATIESYRDNASLPDGSSTIQVRFLLNQGDYKSPPPEGTPMGREEGGRFSVEVDKYERDPRLRQLCLKALGPTCKICGFDFEEVYGEIGRNFCHIHHLQPLAAMEGPREVDPLKDLIPVCPNCHSMLHARDPVYEPDELRETIRNKGNERRLT